MERILNGEEPLQSSVNEVTDVPDSFKQWVEDNAERIENAKNMPYFLSNNTDYINLNTASEQQYVERTQENAKEEIKAYVEPVKQEKEVIQETFDEVARQWNLRQGVTEEMFNSCDMVQRFGLNEFKLQVTGVLSQYGVDIKRAWIR